MSAEIGHAALWLALALALITATLPLYGAHRRDARLMALAPSTAIGQFVMVGIAFAALMVGYLASDFSITNVASNSHSLKPLLYKITGVWGNHEGSLLLWVMMLTLFGAAVAVFGRNLPAGFRARALSVQSMVAVGFLLFILLTSNPFARLDPAPFEGNGLNPLLQDPGLAFHPPMLYLGYVGFSVAFSFAVAALLEGEVNPSWARWVRPWTLFAWTALTGGIALGSWWAYYELGWGGWWFWDPVENASLMPWLAGTALLHSAIVVEKRDTLKAWTILLAILTFSLSLLGTFIVRSGVLTSVHAFAEDPERGVFILAFLIAVVGGSLTLFALRASALKPGGIFAPVSRESALVLNNLLLTVAMIVVLVGTLSPLLLDALWNYKVTVAGPFFNFATLILAPLLALLMVPGPMLAWKRADLTGVLQRLKFAAGTVVIIAIISLWQTAGGTLIATLGLVMGGWLVAGTLLDLAGRIKLFRAPLGTSFNRAAGLPRSQYGAMLGHMGLGILILGITASETWTDEKLTLLQTGESATVGGYTLTLDRAEAIAGANYTALRGTFTVERDNKMVTVLTPEGRTYTSPPMETTEAAIHSLFTGDLYAVIGEPNGDGAWAVRLYWKPLVPWMWGGVLIMMLGGVLSISDRRLRLGAPKRAAALPHAAPAE